MDVKFLIDQVLNFKSIFRSILNFLMIECLKITKLKILQIIIISLHMGVK